MNKIKIALVCASGGHLTSLIMLQDAFSDHSTFYITYDSGRTRKMREKNYLVDDIGTSSKRMLYAFFRIMWIFKKERPDIIISTGSEIAIPAFAIGKLMGKHCIFIEDCSRISTKSGTGRAVYLLSDVFIVMWPELLKQYGKKAQYWGGLI